MNSAKWFGLLMTLAIVAGACTRQRLRTVPVEVRASEEPRIKMNPRVFAADGMCADKLVEHYDIQLDLSTRIIKTLRGRLAHFKKVRANVGHSRYYPDLASETRAGEELKENFAFWRDVHAPFNKRYGTFWCLRRSDMSILSSTALEDGIDEIWTTVKHLGPLPEEKNFELKE